MELVPGPVVLGRAPDPELARTLLAHDRSPAEQAEDELTEAQQKAKDEEAKRRKAIVDRGLKRFQFAADDSAAQRKREIEDLNFDADDQWLKEFRTQRAPGIGPDGRQVPGRPCLTINKLDQPVQQIINEARQGRLAIVIKPKGRGATKDHAEVRQGLIRSIEVESRANIARLWALERAVKCGRGAYRIQKKYANDGDFEMDLVYERILNQHSVYFDPFAQEPDWSDGSWCIITSDVPEDEHKRRWPYASLSNATGSQLESLGNSLPGWITTGGGNDDKSRTRSFRVAEYYYVVYVKQTLLEISGVGNEFLEDLTQAQLDKYTANNLITNKREVDRRQVKWCVFNGVDLLDEEDWDGRYIPVIPVIGKEYNIDGKRMFKGVISNAKDAQRSYNVMRSAQVEAVGLAPKAPWIMAEGQDEGFEEMWDQANVRNFTRLKYKPTTHGEHLVPPPQRNVAEPAIEAITMAANAADGDIKATTGRFDPSLGRVSSTDRSGKAIQALKAQGETGTSNYLDSLANISMVYEGKVINDLLKYVYFEPGRIVRILGDEDREREVMLNQAYTPGQPVPNGKRTNPPVPLQEGEQFDPNKHKKYNLAEGEFSVVVTVGQSFQTRREEASAAMDSLATAAPLIVPQFADLWVRSMDFPWSTQIADRLKKNNPAATEDDNEDGPPAIPPEVQRQMDEQKTALEEAQQMVQQLQQAIDTDKAKIEAESAMKQQEIAARAQADEQKAQMLLEVKKVELAEQFKVEQAKVQLAAEAEKLKIANLAHAEELKIASAAKAQAAELALRERIEEKRIKADLVKAQATLNSEKGLVLLEAEVTRMEKRLEEEHEEEMADDEHEHEESMAELEHTFEMENAKRLAAHTERLAKIAARAKKQSESGKKTAK